MAWLVVAAFLAGTGRSVFAQETDTPSRTNHRIALSFGMHRGAERDAAYSLLVFSGTLPVLGAHYLRVKADKTDHLHLALASGTMANRYGAEMRFFHAGLFTYKFYHRQGAEKSWQWGWSNQNGVSIRSFADADNFNPRADVHTTFGPALQYQVEPEFLGNRLRFDVQAHLQVIGFLIASDYVSPYPAGFTDRGRSGFSALWHSVRPLYPGAVWHWGLWPQVRYRLGNGNAIGLSYRYDMVLLRGAHWSSGSRGQYLCTLIMAL